MKAFFSAYVFLVQCERPRPQVSLIRLWMIDASAITRKRSSFGNNDSSTMVRLTFSNHSHPISNFFNNLICLISLYFFSSKEFINNSRTISLGFLFLSCHVRVSEWIHLNVKELLARSRREIWRLIDCNWTRTQNHLGR